MAFLYGVDTSKPKTPIMVRDAIIDCFFHAHREDTRLAIAENDVSEELNRGYCRDIVKKAFKNSGGDFENPTKDSLLAVVEELKNFSSVFRDPKIISKHADEILSLIKKIKE